MARDQQAQNQLATTNAAAQQAGGQASQLYGMAQPAIANQLNPSGATTNALTQLPMQSANAAFDAAKQSASERVAKTNNSAGYSELADKLALGKGSADSTAALKGQEAIQNLQNTGVENSSKLYGMDQDAMAKLYGLGPSTLQAGTAETNASYGPLNGIMGLAGQIGGGWAKNGFKI